MIVSPATPKTCRTPQAANWATVCWATVTVRDMGPLHSPGVTCPGVRAPTLGGVNGRRRPVARLPSPGGAAMGLLTRLGRSLMDGLVDSLIKRMRSDEHTS